MSLKWQQVASHSSPDIGDPFTERKAALKRSASESCFPGASTSSGAAKQSLLSRRARPELPQPVMRGQYAIFTRRQWQHVIGAFLLGVLVAYAIFALSIHMGHPCLGLATNFGQESPWAPSSRQLRNAGCRPAQGLALSPLALGNLTGNPLATPDQLIVAARHTDDTSWLDIYLSHIPHVVYQVDDPSNTVGAQHATLANKGNEAMAYLQFIVDYYDRLPATIVFLHGHRGTWHMKDHVPLLQRLRWGALPFANLRYANSPGDRLDWECGDRTLIEEFRAFNCNWQGSHLWPRGMRPRKESQLHIGNKDSWWDSVELREVWPDVYEAEMGELPEELKAPCCAEFMVVKERILAHPRDFYIHLRDWIVETELGRYRSGRVFEYMWHVIFGEPHVIEAVPECDLLHCDD